MQAREIVQRAKAGGIADPRSGAGISADITMAHFVDGGLSFADLPRSFPAGRSLIAPSAGTAARLVADVPPSPSRCVASGARQQPHPVRVSDGQVVQRRVGWSASAREIVVLVAERPLRAVDGDARRYRPAESWHLQRRTTYEAARDATRRVGVVPFDRLPAVATEATGPGQDGAADDHGLAALGYLPAIVRAGVRARVPAPVFSDGSVLQFSGPDGTAVRQEVDVVRLDAVRAVVVHAERHPSEVSWHVTQAAFDLTSVRVEER